MFVPVPPPTAPVTPWHESPWLFVGVAAVFVIVFVWSMVGRKPRRPECPRCDYDLTPKPEGPCPECGWVSKRVGQSMARRRRRRTAWVNGVLALVAVGMALWVAPGGWWVPWTPSPVLRSILRQGDASELWLRIANELRTRSPERITALPTRTVADAHNPGGDLLDVLPVSRVLVGPLSLGELVLHERMRFLDEDSDIQQEITEYCMPGQMLVDSPILRMPYTVRVSTQSAQYRLQFDSPGFAVNAEGKIIGLSHTFVLMRSEGGSRRTVFYGRVDVELTADGMSLVPTRVHWYVHPDEVPDHPALNPWLEWLFGLKPSQAGS